MFKGFGAGLIMLDELPRALIPGINPAPMLPPASADNLRNLLLLVDIEFAPNIDSIPDDDSQAIRIKRSIVSV
jgi:hypothetical protein